MYYAGIYYLCCLEHPHTYNYIACIAFISVCAGVLSRMVHSLCTCQAGIIMEGHDEEREK